MMNAIVENVILALSNHSITSKKDELYSSFNEDVVYVDIQKEGICFTLSLSEDTANLSKCIYSFDIGYDWVEVMEVSNYEIQELCSMISKIFDEEIKSVELENEYMNSMNEND